MNIPIWDSWLWGGETIIALLPSVRMVWLAGFYGSGKTVFATFLAAQLLKNGLVARVVSNIEVTGQAPVIERVPAGSRYYSKYLEKWFYPGQRFPMEDTAILLDEAALYLSNWAEAKDYVAALRKTNLYLLMPSIWPPVGKLRAFEIRRTLNLYGFGIPAWQFTYFLTNGKSVAEKGTFYLWRPHRLFGVAKTTAFPKDDGGVVDAIGYTFELDKIKANRAKSVAKRKIATLDFGSAGGSDAASDFADVLDSQQAWGDRSKRNDRRR